MEDQILKLLSGVAGESKWRSSYEVAAALGIKHEEIVGAFKSLEASQYLILQQEKESKFELTEEGRKYASEGTPEYQIFAMILEKGGSADKAALEAALGPAFKVGLTNGVKRLFTVDKSALVAIPGLTLENTPDKDSLFLKKLESSDYFDGQFKTLEASEEIPKMKKRSLFAVKTLTFFRPTKGPNFQSQLVVKRADFTAEDLAKGTWKDSSLFKAINLNAVGREVISGGLHPLLKMKTEYRQILLEMGFEEMRTNCFVENSFWNFDSLYQPQQHPARDAQDTFFLKTPASSSLKCPELQTYFEKVRSVHEKGFNHQDNSSTGWQYPWSAEEALRNVLRTHTTAISSRYLKQLADEFNRTGKFEPKKLFSIDKVYRNETLDATHLAEFHQIEGLIVGKNLGLQHLKAVIREFFAKIGISELMFKPAYNPYTEPSMEIFCFHPVLKRNVEIGNSGVFRPEMLTPMGWPKDVSVIAWGLSLERPAMIHFGCGNIRELVGHKVPLSNVRHAQTFTF